MRNFQEVKEVGMKEANELLGQGWMIAEIIDINGRANYVMGMLPTATIHAECCDRITPMEEVGEVMGALDCEEHPEIIEAKMREEIGLRIEEAESFNQIATSRAKKLCAYAGQIRADELEIEKGMKRSEDNANMMKMVLADRAEANKAAVSAIKAILASRSWIDIHKIAEELLPIFDKTK